MGKRIGAPGYRYTVNLWMRGILEDHYGMKATDVSWVTCEREGAGYVPPKDVDITIRERRTPEDLVLKGEVDAIFVPQLRVSFLTGKSGLRRLFRDPQAEMRNYFRSTGIFPVTHVLVMKKELVERPWIAENMYRAFTAAQRQCDELYRYESKMVSLPDAVFILEQQRAAWGENVVAWLDPRQPQGRRDLRALRACTELHPARADGRRIVRAQHARSLSAGARERLRHPDPRRRGL